LEISKKASIKRQNGSSMEKKYFPIFIDISEMKIVVIGGGTIATRRINTLLGFAEKIFVAAPEITTQLQELVDAGKIIWEQKAYCKNQIEEADMVIAATNCPKVNHQVKSDCEKLQEEKERHIWINVVNDKSLCEFYFPGVVQKDNLVIGINSGGSDPGLVKNTRKRIQELFKKNEYGQSE